MIRKQVAMNKLKMAIIGGGSSYTPELIEGIIEKHKELPITELVLVDIKDGKHKLDIITGLSKRMIKASGLNIKLNATYDLDEALKDASYVVTQFRVGGLKARSLDERIPISYDMIGQETTGAGGFAKALRTIPVVLDIARRMERLCPDAWLINFTNPSGMVTEAVLNHTSIRSIGLCNVPINMKMSLVDELDTTIDDIYCEFIGLNHLSWIQRVFVEGKDVTASLFEDTKKRESVVANVPEVDGAEELIKSLRLIPSPYLNYFYFEKFMVQEEKESINTGKGSRAEQVMAIEEDLFKLYESEELSEKPSQLSERGGSLYSEAAISLIESIHTNSGKMHVLNVINNGAVRDLNDDAVIETNCVVTNSGARPIVSGFLPAQVKGLVQSVKNYEQLTIEAVVEGSKDKALLALMSNPLVHGADIAKQILNDILDAHGEYVSYIK